MAHINFEFKAQRNDIDELENVLLSLNPKFIGQDHQIDTYFNVANGRLKLREGNIENALIYYERENTTDAKLSTVLLYQHLPNPSLKEVLTKVHGVKTVVDKIRKIYFIDNVKFHFDTVAQLGTFIEVEAIDSNGTLGLDTLKMQCEKYAHLFGITPQNYIAFSYSDLLLNKIG
jgi:adenylate cyclase, class 2